MLDIKLIREKPEYIKEMLKKRDSKVSVDELLDCDTDLRKKNISLNKLRHERNATAEKIADLKRRNLNTENDIKRMQDINADILSLEQEVKILEEKINALLLEIPNILHESVPIGKDSSANIDVRKWGEIPELSFKPKSHVDIIEHLDLADTERAARSTGARFYYLKNELFSMGLALVRFTLDELIKKKFITMETPFMLRREAIQGAISLSDFEDVIYKIENEDLYLIATAEHTLLAYHMGEIFEDKDLPKCYAGYSTNFRKEAGAHGKDTKGIFRVRQFDKVEQFVFCRQEDSWDWHEKLIKNAEELYQKLELPYRVVNVCTGDLGSVAAKKYDLECWMPAQKEYREVVSCSNCTDYQARRLNIRYRTKEDIKFVHTLNSTAIAIQRTLVAILENYQQEGGSIIVPKVLRRYMDIARIETKG